jgi:hypothetical protein
VARAVPAEPARPAVPVVASALGMARTGVPAPQAATPLGSGLR